jgi:predicted nucleotidyltransferase
MIDKLSAPDEVVRELGRRMRSVLGDELVGLYLYGSFVSGGFEPGVSDVDFVAVTRVVVDDARLVRLEQMHRGLDRLLPGWRNRIEVVYVDRRTLEAFRTSRGELVVISPGEPLHRRTEPPVEWLQNWYLVRETGRTVHGVLAAEVIPKISWKEFMTATTRYIRQLEAQDRTGAGAGGIGYAVLTAARGLRAARLGVPSSKEDAAAWVRAETPEWSDVVDEALGARRSGGHAGFEDPGLRAAAEDFIRFVTEQLGPT